MSKRERKFLAIQELKEPSLIHKKFRVDPVISS